MLPKFSSRAFLAPMAGITDLPFRHVVSSFKTGHFVSEMIASQEILSGRQGVRQKAELGVDTANTSVQISGRDPYAISETAKLVEGLGAKIIDKLKLANGSILGAGCCLIESIECEGQTYVGVPAKALIKKN